MAPNEIFPNPVVKNVAFEVRFPNLFSIEGRIGEFQTRIMKEFPNSELVHRRAFMFLSGNPPDNIQDLAKQQAADSVDKVWQFKSEQGTTTLEITSKNLVLTSQDHRSYNHSFRAVIESVAVQFFALVKIPVALRVGLRYINECPIFDKSTETFD